MGRFIRWVLIVLGSLVVLAIGAAGGVYLLSERAIGRTYAIPLEDIAVPSDPARIAEGERLAFLRGCNGCHELNLGGNVFFDEPGVARLIAANLTQVAAVSTDAELARIIRHGVKRDGRGVFGMPSPMFYDLSDDDLGMIIAYLRHAPRVDKQLPPFYVGPTGRLGLALGKFTAETDAIDHTRPRVPAQPLGRYLAVTVCSECHGANLKGDSTTPDLAVVAGYSIEEFRVLMLTGMARGGRELRMMSGVARYRFSHFRADEVGALYAYLSGPR